ncbi:MAG TPA: LamG-like jellyroll fold domain-containing protein [Verrucomicrobiae bacterium]
MRTRSWPTLVMLLAFGLLPASGQDLSFLTNGLVAHYPFNGNANDASGGTNHGIVYGAILATDRFGQANACYRFDGTSAYIKAASDPLPMGMRTVSLWFNAETVENQPVLIGYGGNDCGQTFYMGLNLDHEPGYQVDSHCRAFRMVHPYSVPPVNEWHHWVAVADTNGVWTFLDGQLVAATTRPFPETFTGGRDVCLGVNVGANGYGPYVDENIGYLRGRLDEVRIYNRPLSATEIRVLYDYENHTDFRVTWEPAFMTENSGTVTITVQRFVDLNQPTVLRYRVTGGTAAPGADFVLTNGVLEFAAGVTNMTIPLTIMDDALREGPETILLDLTNTASGWSSQVPLIIQDNEFATLHVWQGSPNPTPPYTSWATAATNIQDAVDAAFPGETVVATNGVYELGERGLNGEMNRVVITNAIVLQSVNGPLVTVINGGSFVTNEVGEVVEQRVRCVWLRNNAMLSGFTLANGGASSGGGVYCESISCVVSNCVLSGNSSFGPDGGGGAAGGTLINCILAGNSANGGFRFGGLGGGAGRSVLKNCTLGGNTANPGIWVGVGGYPHPIPGAGGGAAESTLTNCLVTTNSAGYGGGTYGGTLHNCTVGGNSGGGVGPSPWFGEPSTLNNCVVTGNFGGGASGILRNCLVAGNEGGSDGEFYNCTVVGNNGAVSGAAFNSILYYSAGRNYEEGTSLNHCCTTPMPTDGVGNIAADPQLASLSHLSVFSPCRGAGSAAYATGTDIDGEAWRTPPSIGCDEYREGGVNGPLSVNIVADYTNVAVGFPVNVTGLIEGRTTLSLWEFGDGTISLNQPYETHTWTRSGDHTVTLWAFNDSQPDGVSFVLTIHVVQGLHYVAADGTNPVPPYTSWATAATNIQDAVDAAVLGGTVLVSNGVYAAGERVVVEGGGLNRLVVGRPLTLQSVNGPEATIIDGGASNRCVYLVKGTSLSGFTLTKGLADNGGGVLCEATTAVVSNCVITGNSSGSGGGACGGRLNDCTLTGNSASDYGGGVYGGTLNNCTLTANSATAGGGAAASTVYHCTLSGNTAINGGGAYEGAVANSIVTSNSASGNGGGANAARLDNCFLASNSATNSGGGTYQGTLNNCTVVGNSARGSGNGTFGGTLNNCIVYYNRGQWNSSGSNYTSGILNYCCTTPLPNGGAGNIAVDPQLATARNLSAGSPCRGAGSAAYATGADLDGDSWGLPPSIGCDEYYGGTVTGPLNVRIAASHTNVVVGFPVTLAALIEGRATLNVWGFGDGLVASNQLYASHTWAVPGDYQVILRAYNGSYPEGASATVTIHVQENRFYVAANSANPAPLYSTWATAARNIQAAVDVALPGALVLVSNGVYAGGVTVGKPLTLESVSGPELTIINGNGNRSCVYLTNGASLYGFTLTNGFADSGGGVLCQSATAVVSNCIVTGNSASYYGGGVQGGTLLDCALLGNSAPYGGGAAYSVLRSCALTGNKAVLGGAAFEGNLNNCLLARNAASSQGGGAAFTTLNNCTLTGNSALYGGGAYGGMLNNCIVYFNTAGWGGDNSSQSTLNFCCTTPMPTNGVGNLTNDPAFMDLASGDFRLRSHSPCIDAGTDLSGIINTDILGLPRPMDGDNDGLAQFDIGAYEFNPYRFEPALQMGVDGFRFTIRGEPGRSVRIERSRDLLHWEFAGEVPIPASGQTLVDPATTSEPRLFYRATRVP